MELDDVKIFVDIEDESQIDRDLEMAMSKGSGNIFTYLITKHDIPLEKVDDIYNRTMYDQAIPLPPGIAKYLIGHYMFDGEEALIEGIVEASILTDNVIILQGMVDSQVIIWTEILNYASNMPISIDRVLFYSTGGGLMLLRRIAGTWN